MTAMFAVVHTIGLDWHLPHHGHTDEIVLWLQLQRERGLELQPHERLLALCYPSLLGKLASFFVPSGTAVPTDFETLRNAAGRDVVGIRALVAVLSALVVPATWFVARRIVASPWAFLAAGLAGSSTIAIWYSSMGRPHAVVAVFTTATVAASLRARASGQFLDFVLAGAFAAAAVSTLHSGACACVAVAAAWFWCEKPRFGTPLAGAVAAAALVLTGILVFLRGESLPALEVQSAPGDDLLSFLGMGVHNVDTGYFNAGGFERFVRAMRDYEPVLSLLAIAGVVALALAPSESGRTSTSRAVLRTWLAQPLAHLVLFGAYGDSFQRFWFPLIPHIAILATVGVATIVSASRGKFRLVPRLFVAALLVIQMVVAVKLVVLRARDDTYEVAAQWVRAHPEHAPFLAGPTVDLPLVPRDPAYRQRLLESRLSFMPWVQALGHVDPALRSRLQVELHDLPLRRREERERLTKDPARFVDDLGAGVVLVEHVRHDRRQMFGVLREELLKRGQPIATFEPQVLGVRGAQPIDYLLDGPHAPEAWFAWSALWAARLGPEIEVFEIAL